MPLKPLQLSTHSRPALAFIPLSEDMYDFEAPYQRDAVWTIEHRVALIKSMLLKLPIGAVYINVRDFDLARPYVIMDGKQRIQAIRDFHDNKYGVPANWFFDRDLNPPIEGDTAYFKDLTLVGRNRIMQCVLPTIEARVASIEEEAEIFMLINTAGVAQTPETLDNANSYAKAGK